MVPFYERIKTLRKEMIVQGPEGKVTVHGALLDFPSFVYDNAFSWFLDPQTGEKVKADQVIRDRITDPKTYGQIFHTTDFRVCLTNSAGHVLKLPKQWVMPMGIEEIEESKEEGKEKYEAFYKDPGKDSLQIDFANQAMLCKRQEKLLEVASAKKEEHKIFDLLKQIGPWIILMCEGGSFSIAVFDGMTLVSHKSDKKYLIRKMAGKRQANKDRRKSVMTSVGSQMRREMEKIHQANVANIMEECQKSLAEAKVIFLHAPGINRSFFLTEGMPLKQYISKIKPIILRTKKANFENVMEVFEKLITVSLTFPQAI